MIQPIKDLSFSQIGRSSPHSKRPLSTVYKQTISAQILCKLPSTFYSLINVFNYLRLSPYLTIAFVLIQCLSWIWILWLLILQLCTSLQLQLHLQLCNVFSKKLRWQVVGYLHNQNEFLSKHLQFSLLFAAHMKETMNLNVL